MSSHLPDKVKVLLIIYKLERGGAERVVVSLAKGLSRKKYEIAVCCFKGGVFEEELQACGIPVFKMNKRGLFDLSILFKLLKIIKKEKFDIVHTHSFSANLWGRVAAFLSRVPIVISTEHTLATAKTKMQRHIDNILARITTKIIAVSKTVRNSLLEEENIPADNILAIYNGIDFTPSSIKNEAIQNKKKELGVGLNNKVVVTIGRLEPPKGYEYLLESARTVTDAFPSTRFLIVGGGYLRPALENLAGRLNICDKVILAGPRTDIADILSFSDVAVLPSVREGFSITLLEYMACGKPIVATDVGGNTEAVINGISGIIVPSKDPAALAGGIMNILRDEKLAESLGRNARERFRRKFTIQKMILETENLYETLCSQVGPQRTGK
jgi:glycosyltransferase involved in cell wall biosynthesis